MAKTSLYLNDEIHRKAKAKGAMEDVSLTEAVEGLLELWVAGRVKLPK